MGPDARLTSFSFSLIGDGESSMISTHPDLSPAGVLVTSLSLSILCLLSMLVLFGLKVLDFSGEEDRIEDFELDAVGDVAPEGSGLDCVPEVVCARVAVALILPIRIRGTRVWIFCSNTLTRARISETICTPLLRVAATVLVMLELDTLRVVSGGTAEGVRSGARVGVEEAGVVEERASGDGIPEVLIASAERGWKPARWRADGTAAVAGRGVLVFVIKGERSLSTIAADASSASCNSVDKRLDK